MFSKLVKWITFKTESFVSLFVTLYLDIVCAKSQGSVGDLYKYSFCSFTIEVRVW